jgi:hypothetical protein
MEIDDDIAVIVVAWTHGYHHQYVGDDMHASLLLLLQLKWLDDDTMVSLKNHQ